MAAKNIVTTDMKTIRDHRDVHETEEFNAYIEMQEKKAAEREANNRRADAGLENERSFNKKVETKKEQQVEKAKEKAKEHKKAQEEKMKTPTPPPDEELPVEVFFSRQSFLNKILKKKLALKTESESDKIIICRTKFVVQKKVNFGLKTFLVCVIFLSYVLARTKLFLPQRIL